MKTPEKLFRYFYVYFIFTVTIFISGFIVNFLQFMLHVTVKPRNKHLFRKINYYLCYTLYSQIVFLAEWYSGVKLVLYANKNDLKKFIGKEHAYVIANHKYEIDWLMLGMLCEKSRCAGNFKAYMKKALQYAPSIGWCLYFSDNVFLERSFEKDKKNIQKQISQLVDYSDPIWLILYPEGTRYTPEKYEASLKVAQEKGLPQLKNLLTPRTKGFVTSLVPMRNKMPAIYDVTVTFDPKEGAGPTLNNMLMGKTMHAHMYLRRIPFENVPQDEQESTKFLHDMFIQKDKLHGSFLNTGDYSTESGVEKISPIKMDRSIYVFINVICWYIVIDGPLIYYLIKMLFTASLYNISIVYGLLFFFLFIMSKSFDMSQTKKGSTYGINTKKTN